jgi:GTPase
LPGSEQVQEQLAAESGREVLLISAVTGQGLNQLVRQIDAVLTEQRQVAS